MTQVTANVVSFKDAAPVGKTAACEACGAPLDALDRFCGACGTPHQPEQTATRTGGENVGTEASPTELASAVEHKFFRCKNCGAEVATDPGQRSYVCPFCDSTYVVEFSPQQTDRKPPEFVAPFAVSPDKALELFQKWIGNNGLFRPGDLRTSSR